MQLAQRLEKIILEFHYQKYASINKEILELSNWITRPKKLNQKRNS